MFIVPVSVAPDKNANSEKPTILKSEYKKDRKRTTVPIPPRSKVKVLLGNKRIISMDQINRYSEYIHKAVFWYFHTIFKCVG
jgi:hypothetical protein